MSQWQRGELLYEGKAKKIFAVPSDSQILWVEFKDSLTAFNAQKKGSFADKGKINLRIASLIFRYLQSKGVSTHWLEDLSDREMLCQRVTIIPLEVVVRNRLAGSTAKKFGIEEGAPLETPLVEFYLKNDNLGDPFVSDDQALMIKAVRSHSELETLRQLGLLINSYLVQLFKSCGIDLVDFKMEFGRRKDGTIILADEISPDSCRLWDLKTGERLDKDRFRRDLGRVEDSYRDVLNRLENIKESWL